MPVHLLVEHAQVVQTSGVPSILLADRLPSDFHCPNQQWKGLCVSTGLLVEHAQVVQI